MSTKEFYYIEWKIAEKDSDTRYSEIYKERYRKAVMKSLEKPYTMIHEKLKQFPIIILN